VVRELERDRDFEAAIGYALRAVSADPLREEAHLDLMRLYAAQGQPAAALRQYRELGRLLKEQLDARPSAAARNLAEEIERAQPDSGVQAFRSSGVQDGKPDTRRPATGEGAFAAASPPHHLTTRSPEHLNTRTPEHPILAPTGTVTFLLTDIEG